MNTMRIGVNCFPLQANIGGIKQYFFNLFNELLANDSRNEYIFFHFPHNAEELAGLESARWRASAVLLNDQLEVKHHLDQIDLYFCPFGALWPRPLPLPTVVTLVDVQEAFYPQFFAEYDMYNREWHLRGSTHMADRVITISHFSKKTIAQYHKISPCKVTVAHLCADKRYRCASEVARSPRALLPPSDFILYPANYWVHKNHDILLRGLQRLKAEKGLKIDAVFTGYEVPNGYPLAQKTIEYGLDDQIYPVGYVTVEELAYLYLKARMLVFPSLFEGFGIPLVEAMTVGCPIVAAEVTSLPEIGAEAAAYFDPTSVESVAAVIERVWQDETTRQQLIERGRQRSSAFSAAQLASIHLGVFEEATRVYSPVRFMWHNRIYQHYHRWRVQFKYRDVLLARKGWDVLRLTKFVR
jgi:glycosyltransferase involved in cell wall biosynthesis